jgi:hypothetical protein
MLSTVAIRTIRTAIYQRSYELGLLDIASVESRLGGAVVSVLATGLKDRDSNPAEAMAF